MLVNKFNLDKVLTVHYGCWRCEAMIL